MSKQPLVSLANLVEYATTPSAARRRQIIEQYHNPEVIKFDWHGASDAIFTQRACGSASANSLIDIEKRQIQSQMTGETEKDRRRHHVLHLIELLEASDVLRLTDGTAPSLATALAPEFLIGKLKVRVRPNLLLSKINPKLGISEFWIIKCHTMSTLKLSINNTGSLYGVGLQLYAEGVLGTDNISSDLCRVYDLYDDKPYNAPRKQTRLRLQLTDAAQEDSR